MNITAAVLEGPQGPFRVQPVVLESPREDEILVEIAGTGLCHSDLLFESGDIPFSRPIVLGHEGSGTVREVGPRVKHVKPGDRVLISYASCGSCRQCERAAPQYCVNFYPLNAYGMRLDGSSTLSLPDGTALGSHWFAQSSFASHVLTLERNVVVVNDPALPLELLGPFGCGIQTGAGAVMNTMQLSAGSSIAVFGVGGVGAAGIMAAHAAGATTIIAVDVHESRLAMAKRIGATHTLNVASVDDVAAAVRDLADGPLDFALDTSAVAARNAVDVIGPGGVAVLLAASMGELTLDGNDILFGKTVKGAIEGDAVPQILLPRLVELYRQGRFPIDEIVTTYPLEDIEQAIADMKSGVTIKPVLIPTQAT